LADLFSISGVTAQYFIWNRQKGCYETNRLLYPDTYPQTFSKSKRKNAFRIFIFGGSCVKYLKDFDLLRENLQRQFPHIYFEIINVGISAYGSTRLLPIVKEAFHYQPDLLIYYEGHNEFLELYLLNHKTFNFFKMLTQELFKVKAFVFLYKAISGIFFQFQPAVNFIFNTQPVLSWGRPLSKTERLSVYLKYKSNLGEMIHFAKGRNVPMIISTVAYNYIDDRYISPNFFSEKHKNTRFNSGQKSINAISDQEVFHLAEKLRNDPYLENRMGQFYLKEKEYNLARKYFVCAADDDYQPFHANNTINNILKELSHDNNIPLAEVENVIVQNSPNKIPDFALFTDWCHLNLEGNKLLQIEFFNKIKDSLPKIA
jgi:hypothetical protein